MDLKVIFQNTKETIKKLTKPEMGEISHSGIDIWGIGDLPVYNPDDLVEKKGLEIENGRVLVTINATDENTVSNLIDVINRELGGQVSANYQILIDAWIPINALEKLCSLPEVNYIQKPVEILPLE